MWRRRWRRGPIICWFCYDEQYRLTWASSAANASTPCGGSHTAGTLTSAMYSQSVSYDALNRLTSSPLVSYTYGDSAHLHAATARTIYIGGKVPGEIANKLGVVVGDTIAANQSLAL